MIIRTTVLLVLLLGAISVHAGELLRKGMPFFEARNLTLKHGWQPLRMHSVFVKEGDDGFPSSNLERALINRGVVEISSCSLGKTWCVFYYARKNQCFMLETQGEQIKWMRLVHWELVKCPIPE